MDDEKYYQTVADELRSNRINDALWTKAIAKSQGDENKTKAMYIQLRVEQIMRDEKADRLAAGEHTSNSRASSAPIPAQVVAQWIVAAVLVVVILLVVKNWVLPKLAH